MPALLKPLKGEPPITQLFGQNPQWYPLTKGHNGIDWGIPEGTPVYAAADGIVTVAGPDDTGYGTHVRIQHKDCLTIYGHLSRLGCQRDDRVKAGQCIGYSGNTGNSTGPHLHFEVRLASSVYSGVNPMPLFVSTLPASDASPLITVVTIVDDLRLRAGPGTNYPIIKTLKAGTKLRVFDIAGDTLWIRVDDGFVAARYAKEDYVLAVRDPKP